MHIFLVILVSLVITIENILPSIIGFQKTPAGAMFLGTVHHSGDYFYYLSQFSLGATHWITTTDLYTGELLPDSLIGWSNTLTGHIFHLVGISAIPAYQISIAIWTFLLCLSAYQLALTVFKDKRKALLSLVLFGLYHAFPVMRDGHWSYADYWNNFSVPRVRLGGVPHQLFLNTLSFFLLSKMLTWNEKKSAYVKWKTIVTTCISALFLASLQPILWILIVTSSTSAFVMYHARTIKKHLLMVSPIVYVFLAGFPAALYLNHTFASLPFSQLKSWESLTQTPLSLKEFILAMGPLFLVALMSLYQFIKPLSYQRLVIVIFGSLSLLLFTSHIPFMLHFSNARFMATLTILCVSIVATEGIFFIMSRLQKANSLVSYAILFALMLTLTTLLIPSHVETIRLSTQFQPLNAYEYLSVSDATFLTSLSSIGSPTDTFLVLWPYNLLFPALSGHKSYHGHPLLTIHAKEKDREASIFFDGKESDATQRDFLKQNNIRYVIAYSWQDNLKTVSYLEAVVQTRNLTLYKVTIHP